MARFVNDASEEGIVPVKEFSVNDKKASCFKLEREDGIVPLRPSPERFNSSRFVMVESQEGIVPVS